MKALFTGFLTVSLSGSLILCLVLLLRLIFSRAPKALICALWSLAIIRLLLPFQIQNPVSLRPETPVLSSYDTQLFVDTEPVSSDSIPQFVPQKFASIDDGDTYVVIDYVAIAANVWAVVAGAMLLYMLISYIRLRFRVRESIRAGKSEVYTCDNIRTAFLLGYFRPKIYLPLGLGEKETQLIINHERAHKKRGDNWLKLLGFICLAMHWFNPLVWITYILLCRDIEDACDEYVVRNLNEEDRRSYSSALLSCGRERAPLAACPVAFGEISIKQRILNVLNYKKPALWICIVLIVAILLVTVFFMTDPFVQKHPPLYDKLTGLLGHSKTELLEELQITENDIVGGSDLETGKTPIQVEYHGIKFNLMVFFDRAEENFASFAYLATYDDTEQAAKDTLNLSRHLWRCYGEGYQAEKRENSDILSKITLEEIREMFKNRRRHTAGIDEIREIWDITDNSGRAVRKYIEEYEASENWQALYGPEGTYKEEMADLRWRLRFSAWSDADPDTPEVKAPIYIVLDYKTGIDRDRNAYIAAYFAQEQSWWEKLWNWLK